MSAEQLTDSCIAAINKGIYAFVVINYANPDMVGHTGRMEATTEAISTVEHLRGSTDGSHQPHWAGPCCVTADHGNAELMEGPDGRPWTAHTTNPVPVILVEGKSRKLPGHGTDTPPARGRWTGGHRPHPAGHPWSCPNPPA